MCSLGEPLKQKVGDAEAALAAAPRKVDVVYTTPRHHHSPIELHGCTLGWEGDALRIHDASQAVAHEAWTIAEVFGLKEKQVRLTSPMSCLHVSGPNLRGFCSSEEHRRLQAERHRQRG